MIVYLFLFFIFELHPSCSNLVGSDWDIYRARLHYLLDSKTTPMWGHWPEIWMVLLSSKLDTFAVINYIILLVLLWGYITKRIPFDKWSFINKTINGSSDDIQFVSKQNIPYRCF